MDPLLNALQWPAMVVTLVAAWLVGGRSARRRTWGFWVFVLSNLLWCVWGAFTQSYALIVLQLGLFAMNLRGVRKNKKEDEEAAASDDPG
ncbi:hypothetical protein [Roseateles noduli]|jgi:hypothetical protein|uniref:hypothetical protein n=1 Tax=Roseateles noduli TaxID=2052484 RepID=UPI003D657411